MSRLVGLLAVSVTLGCTEAQKPTPPPPKVDAPVKAPPKAVTPTKRVPMTGTVPRELIPTKGRPKNAWVERTPEFVERGSGAFTEGNGRYFFSVGVARHEEDHKKAHLLADTSADAEMLKVLQAYNAEVLEAAGKKEDPKLTALAKTWVEKHATIVDHWLDHDPEDWYSLKRIDAAAYSEAVKTTLGLAEIKKP